MRTVPYRTPTRQCPISFSRLHDNSWVSKKKKTHKAVSLWPRRETYSYAGTCLTLWTGPSIHPSEAIIPESSHLRSSRSCRSTSSPALRRTLMPSSRDLIECSWMGAIRSGAGVINTSASPVGSALPSSPVGGRGRKPCEPS